MILIVFVVVILLLSLFIGLTLQSRASKPGLFVGVDVGFGDEEEVYRTADEVTGYANLIVIGSLAVTSDNEKLIRVCDYLYARGFYFIVYAGFSMEGLFPPVGPDSLFFKENQRRWGNKLLGAYIFDEPGGNQLDNKSHRVVENANNITDAAEHYVITLGSLATLYHGPAYYGTNLGMYTSDYALYWYDYLAGYDVVLGQFVGNQSRQVAVSMTRGGATIHEKDWGVMITWKYQQPPYVEEPEQLYDDMVLAYENGANYIVVFNSPDVNEPTTTYGILTKDHFDAIRRFWDYSISHPRSMAYHAQTAYVLPSDYGYGFRGPSDNIWGLWPANELSAQVWADAVALLDEYNMNLDFVYQTRIDSVPATLEYDTLVFWNGTIVKRSMLTLSVRM